MWNNYCGCNQVSPAYDMGSCDGGKNNSSTFVLIVVLFILLIIVGSYCW
nr:YjcZ family sporulation protein [Ureibacillus massiliensis]